MTSTGNNRARVSAWISAKCLIFLLVVLIILQFVMFLRTAWLCDDIYLSFRTIDNFFNGYGLRWNVADRTQVYTHPLWVFTLMPMVAITGEYYYAALGLSLLCATAALVLTTRFIPHRAPLCLALLALLTSRAYQDYTSSGLENPLSHLLVVCFLVCLAKCDASPRSIGILVLLFGAALLNRLDLMPLYAPAMMWILWLGRKTWRGTLGAALLGLMPLGAWLVFSLLYYGTPLPNTAYAKVFGAPLTQMELFRCGAQYFWNALLIDRVTLIVLAAGIVAGLCGPAWARFAALGIVLQLAFTLKVGGDFMAGRFLSVPFFCAVLIAARHPLWQLPGRAWGAAAAALLITGLTIPNPPLFSGADYGHQPSWVARGNLYRSAVLDERGNYYPYTGLLKVLRHGGHPIEVWSDVPIPAVNNVPPVLVSERVGLLGLRAGPQCHVIDVMALGDPFLSRLPAQVHPKPKIGHFRRCLPKGYQDTLRTGVNTISGPGAAALYDTVSAVTRGPLLSRKRLRAMWHLHTGQAMAGLDRSRYEMGRDCETDIAE